MQSAISNPSTTVSESGATAAGIFRCPITHPLHRDSGPTRAFVIAFPRTTGWLCHEGGRPMVITPSMATIYNRGQRYTRRRIASKGDFSDWIAITKPEVIRELASAFDAASVENPERPLRFPYARISADLYKRQRLFFWDLRNGLVDPLEAEEEILSIFRAVLFAMRETWEIRGGGPIPLRSGDYDRIQRIHAIVGSRFRKPLRLEALAREVELSVVHMCRLFRRHAGTSIHATVTDLRLRAALGAIRRPGAELAEVALDLGFASQSHFTEMFRRKFGRTPAQMQRR